jgi:small subunit ribosomal protein S3
MTVVEITNPDFEAKLVAEFVGDQLEKRIPFRRAVKQALQRAKRAGVKGIKIQVSGRLNGAEIARSEWVREGRVPLQTLRSPIDYCTHEAHTIYGILGIKVWVFKG